MEMISSTLTKPSSFTSAHRKSSSCGKPGKDGSGTAHSTPLKKSLAMSLPPLAICVFNDNITVIIAMKKPGVLIGFMDLSERLKKFRNLRNNSGGSNKNIVIYILTG
jgi:hypothetical protein